ncbi:hypothetical protein GCM10012290_05300 [Halolactibacillus alkaliphilus]|uniref:Uncharacterized protein n=2 Tax=Halolactibacillus alkaliphilus TaxID=442899 RepID=A0A511WXJ0_9BACI|nr:carbohydrate-binding domain-containing protein [Halolactibacillus alkaliphilus]GEN55836.1 hypothetical protein HAL01_03000 [Halolactibacillus alkaliphilus]GGN66016.1 hypothetical protein GCM10012290_05300 [Halolactibacillus alkaliphilus]
MAPPEGMQGNTTDDETVDETSDDTPSTKGLKAEKDTVIASGTFNINTLDDALHSNKDIQIVNGTFILSSGETGYLAIHGGDITIDASGDGIDSNSTIEMTGGTVIVNGPIDGGNGALDYDETFHISGGILIAAGSSAMAQSPSDDSSQPSIIYQFDQPTTESISLTDDSGQFILGFTPTKSYQTIVVSSPLLETDKTVTWHTTVDLDGEAVNGLITNGVITTSTELNFTLTDTLTYLTPSGVSSTPLTESGFGRRPNRPAQ